MRIREEQPQDYSAVREIIAAEFDTGGEADLVDDLRAEAHPLVALVAEDDDGAIIGTAMLSPVSLPDQPDIRLMGLAPLAVRYDRQRRGTGSALVHAAVERCREMGVSGVVVLGHAEYYRRFGFRPAAEYGLACEYDVPEGAFQALETSGGGLGQVSGTVRYHPAFARL